LDDWSFDVFALADAGACQPVKYVGYDLLNRYGMIHKFKVPSATLEIFLSRIEEGELKLRFSSSREKLDNRTDNLSLFSILHSP